MKITQITFLLLAGMIIAFSSCKKNDPPPPNPYDNVDYGDTTTQTSEPDPNSIIGIHRNILMVKCNNPGCHDGTFEPDFRTVQSAWSTLVYHKIVKNTPNDDFQYRVIPFDTGNSILNFRLTRDSPQLQRMPATGDYLSSAEMENVQNWILAGAPDMLGNLPVFPNNEPLIAGYIAIEEGTFDRLDTNRIAGLPYNPFVIDTGIEMQVIFLIEDDSTALPDLQVNQLKLSYDMDDFSGATTIPAVWFAFGVDVWIAQFNTNMFPTDTTVYMRYYVNDGDHANNTEFPRDDSDDGYKTYAAFYVNP